MKLLGSRISQESSRILLLLSGLVLSLPAVTACAIERKMSERQAAAAQVMLVGTYHFSNPQADLTNVEAVDVMSFSRQREIESIVDSLAKFRATHIGVESSAAKANQDYMLYISGEHPPSSSEVVQLGFRLASRLGLSTVHGVDVKGDFPFDVLQNWVKQHGREQELAAILADATRVTTEISRMQNSRTIGGVLRWMNQPTQLFESHQFYARFLKLGAGDDQPGVALNAAWVKRNLEICARIVQIIEPGDRMVVFYGQGHVYLLSQCLREVPGVEVVMASEYLPDS